MIPKIIHQMYKDHNIPKEQYNPAWSRSWININPEYKYMFWTDQMIKEFLESEYPEYLEFLDSYDVKIKWIDATRYFILDKFGGIYADLDFECYRPITEIFHADIDTVLVNNGAHAFTNALIACRPGSIFIRNLIAGLPDTAQAPVIWATGPGYVTTRYKDFSQKEIVKTLDRNVFFSIEYATYCSLSPADLKKRLDMLAAKSDVFGQHHFNGHWLRDQG